MQLLTKIYITKGNNYCQWTLQLNIWVFNQWNTMNQNGQSGMRVGLIWFKIVRHLHVCCYQEEINVLKELDYTGE